MITGDFVQRTRARIVAARAALAKLRDASKEALREVTRLDKQHTSDKTRVYDQLCKLADDVIDKLPEEAAEADSDRVYEIHEQINNVASEVDEVSFTSSSVEDMASGLKDMIDDVYARLKDAESQLSVVAREGAKIGV
jgi:chromosome segregation ATPase